MNSNKNSCHCYIGLPQWQHSAWQEGLLQRSTQVHALKAYSRHFSSVEGNTTFYGLPKADSVKLWYRETPEHFKFCFKFPQQITHRNMLRHANQDTLEFLRVISHLQEKAGLLCIQLSADFSAEALPSLKDFLQQLPDTFDYAIEVRHLDFFNKGKSEQCFNQLLLKHQINRISFDTRALFAHPANDPISLTAKEHKPQVPVHAIATGNQPMIRFITPLDRLWAEDYLTPWINKAIQWLDEGKTPYFFFHTPDNAEAPELAKQFVERIEALRSESCLFTPWKRYDDSQSQLF